MQHIIPIAESLQPSQLERLGGKGRGLALLQQAGGRVPKTAAVPPEAPIPGAVREVLSHFQDTQGEGIYAVRSSASVEDGRERSYAGQFESFLRVTGLRELETAVEACRRSGESARVAAYHAQGGEVAVSVVVQEMIEADVAGVLFTCDPVSGSRSHVMIEAVSGTAEDLVGGSRPGECFILDRQSVVVEQTGTLLDAPLLTELTEQALALEERLADLGMEGPLDFEWAVRKDQVFWLQVRPVTAHGRSTSSDTVVLIRPEEQVKAQPGEVHWTSINAREAVPGVLTALMEDLIVGHTSAGFEETSRLMGVRLPREHRNTVGVFQGRAFLNLTAMEAGVSLLPVKNPEAVTGTILGQSTEPPRPRWSLSLLGMMVNLLWRQARLPSDYRRFAAREQARWQYPSAGQLNRLDDAGLWRVVNEALQFLHGFSLHILGSLRYIVSYPPLRELCQAHGADAGSMLQGLGTLRFASAAAAMRDLARAVHPVRKSLFDEEGLLKEGWAAHLTAPGAQTARRAFDDYLDEYGHLGTGSVDLVHKTWRNEPERVLQLVGSLLRQGEYQGKEAYLTQLRHSRQKAVAELSSRLGLFERLRFFALLGMAHQAAPYRENVKFLIQRRLGMAREYLLELGGRLLQRPDDIFHLHIGELQQIIDGRDPSEFHQDLQTRKTEYRRCSQLPCPIHRIETDQGVKVYYPAPLKAGGTFRGVGAGAGTAVGKARVLRSLEEAGRLQPGDILVTLTTDPSWTPLFSVAGAVVVEVGSLLSHGAVVAREAGIPAVLGIPGILAAVRDGDILIVDGAAGTVTRQDETTP